MENNIWPVCIYILTLLLCFIIQSIWWTKDKIVFIVIMRSTSIRDYSSIMEYSYSFQWSKWRSYFKLLPEMSYHIIFINYVRQIVLRSIFSVVPAGWLISLSISLWRVVELLVVLLLVSRNHRADGARLCFSILVGLCGVISINRTSPRIHSSLVLTSVDALFCSPDWRTSAPINTWEGWHFKRASILSCFEHFALFKWRFANRIFWTSLSLIHAFFFSWHLGGGRVSEVSRQSHAVPPLAGPRSRGASRASMRTPLNVIPSELIAVLSEQAREINKWRSLFSASLAQWKFTLSATSFLINAHTTSPQPQCLPRHVPASPSANVMKMLNSCSVIPLKNSDLLKRQQLHSGWNKSSRGDV